MEFPRYTYPLRLVPGLLRDFIASRPRSFRRDAQACIEKLDPPLKVFGSKNIPAFGSQVLALNHYHRPGFGAWWIALAIAAAVPEELHWVMTAELTFPGKWYAFLGKPASRGLLARLAKMYGFTTMPPMPPREKDVAARARSVRRVLEHIRSRPGSMLAVSPEGADHPGGVLTWPPTGAGRFLHLLAKGGYSFVPVGCWEENGALCLCFGASLSLEVPPALAADEKDRFAAGTIMRAIASQLPLRMRGDFNHVQPVE